MNVGDNLTAASNTTITIRCPVSGVPTPAVTWLKEGAPIIEGRDVFTTDNKSIVITRAEAKDIGRYTCRIVNVAGMDNSSSEITIIGVCCSCGLERTNYCNPVRFSQTSRKHAQSISTCHIKWEGSYFLFEYLIFRA